jgi:carboxyl-terminal processing protease
MSHESNESIGVGAEIASAAHGDWRGLPPGRPPLAGLGRGARATVAGTVVAGAFALGLAVGTGLPGHGDVLAQSSLTGRPEFATLEETWNLIHEEWPDPTLIDDSTLMYGAAKGMVEAIGDTGHSVFLDPKETTEFAEAAEGKYVGIGVEIDTRCGVPVVTSTMPGSPARAAGLLPGDVITEVNSVSTRQDDVRDLVLGGEGEKLTLTVERANVAEPLHIDIVRQTIAVDPVTWSWMPDHTVQMRISGFEPGVSQDVRQALATVRDAGATRLILDLRGNPGGLVPEVIGVASQFLDEGQTVFQEEGRDGAPHKITTVGRTGEWLDLALVVLVDEQSASGAEVLAAALHDNGRAELIGEKTFGTGTVLSTYPQDDGSSLVLGTAFWLTPDGERIWHEGVAPDKLVPLEGNAFPVRPVDDPQVTESELEGSTDAQLQAAFAALGGGSTAPSSTSPGA